jgi:hypothetical protein
VLDSVGEGFDCREDERDGITAVAGAGRCCTLAIVGSTGGHCNDVGDHPHTVCPPQTLASLVHGGGRSGGARVLITMSAVASVLAGPVPVTRHHWAERDLAAKRLRRVPARDFSRNQG